MHNVEGSVDDAQQRMSEKGPFQARGGSQQNFDHSKRAHRSPSKGIDGEELGKVGQ